MEKISRILLSGALVIAFFYIGRNIIIPFILACFIWFGIKILQDYLNKFHFFKKSPKWIQKTISILTIFIFTFLILNIIRNELEGFAENMPTYQQNIQNQIDYLSATLKIDINKHIQDLVSTIHFSTLFNKTISAATGIISDLFIILFYVIFLIAEQHYFDKKLFFSSQSPEKLKKTKLIIKEIETSIKKYFGLKSLISLITALLAYVIMLLVGLNFAFLWAFLIFVFNFIPNIGSTIATLFPSAFAIAQFPEITPAVSILTGISFLQIIIGNFLEPKIFGFSMNLSPLVVILSLIFWGSIWGTLGMFLAVPIMVVLLIIFSNIPQTKDIAVWLSSNGDLKHH